MIVLTDVDPVVRHHLLKSLTGHAQWCRANGVVLPPAIADMLRALRDSDGHTRTIPAPSPEALHDAAMPLLALDYDQAARRLNVSTRTVRRLVAAGNLHAVSIGGCRRILTTELAAYTHRLDTQ